MSGPRLLVVDVGQTATRVRATTGEDRSRVVEGPGGHHLAEDGESRRSADRIVTAWAQLERPQVDTVVIATTGFAGPAARDLARDVLTRVAAMAAVIADDVAANHVGIFGDGPGVVLVAGTGVVALASDGAGTTARVGGWGPGIDDTGGGHWIGREGLRHAARSADGRGAAVALRRAAESRYGPPARWPNAILGSGRPTAEVAAFAKDVLDLAATDEPVAVGIWTEAVDAWAELVSVAAQRTGLAQTATVHVVGSLCRVSDGLWSRFSGRLLENAGLRVMPRSIQNDPLVSIEALARLSDAGPLSDLVSIVR